MTAKNWCETQGIPIKTFYYRLRVVRENLLRGNETHEIVPITAHEEKMPMGKSTQHENRIHISGNGVEMELPMNVSPELIAAILQGIRSC